MKKLIVKNLEGIQTHGATSDQFESEEAFNSWIEQCVASEVWGRNAHDEVIKDAWTEYVEKTVTTKVPGKPAEYDEEGNEISPEIPPTTIEEVVTETVHHEAETVPREATYTYEIVDITAQVEQERVNAEALAYLNETDWLAVRQAETGVQMPEDVRAARQAARERIVKV